MSLTMRNHMAARRAIPAASCYLPLTCHKLLLRSTCRGSIVQCTHRALHSQSTNNSTSRLTPRIPKGTWDTHMHVVDPFSFPLSKTASYTPSSAHTLSEARDFLSTLGITKMAIVQPSIYKNDNSCTLDGLQQLGPENGRGVVQFDPAHITTQMLKQWHVMGVRGVRLNFKSVGKTPTTDELVKTLRDYAGAVREMKSWFLELYIALEHAPLLEKAVEEAEVDLPIVIAHLCHPNSMKDLVGLDALVRLMERGSTWMKLSATYRLDKDPRSKQVEKLCRTMVGVRPDRCVFATDWPHTRYDDLDVAEYLEAVLDWVEKEGVSLRKVLVKNAEVLLDASP